MRAVLYARLSITRDESVSIQRQLQACRDRAQAEGWTVIGEYVDEGVSASANAPENRLGWQGVLNHPEPYDVVLIWKVDRLARKVLDFLNANDALAARDAGIATSDRVVDMTTATGRAFATMLAVFAEMEADAIRARVVDARRALIRAGRVPGGAAPFGYWNAPNGNGPGKVVQKDPATIGHVVEAAGRALRGDSLNSIAAYLDRVAPRTGRNNNAAHWTITVTRRMLQNPILAGMTSHNPGNTGKSRGTEVLRDSDGLPIVREDLAILSLDEFRALSGRLTTSQPYATRDASYLGGLVWCGECGRKMHRNAKAVNGVKVKVFQCQGKDGCHQQVSHLEEIVAERFLSEFAGSFAHEVESTTDHSQLVEINMQLAECYERIRVEDDVVHLVQRIQALKDAQKRVQSQGKPVLIEQTETVEQMWARDRREAIRHFTDGIRLVKGKVGRRFDQTRLSFISKPVPDGYVQFDSLAAATDYLRAISAE